MRSLALLLVAAPLCAGPQGGSVVDGTATISTAGKITTIQQSTNKAIINWQKFESTPTETIRFNQPGSSSLTLNRVVGVDPSFLGGSLQANGGLFIINPNGIVFGPNAQVNVGSLVASSLNITDADFKNGNFQFLQAEGELSSVINRGSIRASEGGTVALLAPIVDNSGSIVAAAGRVILRAALNAGIDAPVPPVPKPDFQPFPNTATGRNVRMATAGLTPLLEDVVNTQSTVTANKVTRLSDGTVFLRGAGGILVNGGTVDVTKAGGTSGQIALEADSVAFVGAGSRLMAGTTGGGGRISLGANSIGFSKPAGSSGRALIEADTITVGAPVGGVNGDADGSIEFRGGSLKADAEHFGRADQPLRANTERIDVLSIGEAGLISDGDLTVDFLFAVGPGATLRAAGSIFAGTGRTTFMSGLGGVKPHGAGIRTLTAGDQIGTPGTPFILANIPISGARTVDAPNGVNTVEVNPLALVLPPAGASASVDDSTPAPRANYTPPFDPVEVVTETGGAITVVGGATAGLGAATGSGPIVVQSSSTSSSGATIGGRDNVLLSSNRSSLVKQEGNAGPAPASGDDVVVVQDQEPGTQVSENDGEDEEDKVATARRARRENAND